MRCTDCSTSVLPVVAVDIDGTLGDYHAHLLRFAEGYLGRTLAFPDRAAYDGAEPHREWFCRAVGVDVRTYRDIKLAYRQGGLKRSMPAFHGASKFVGALHEYGLEVWITTSRPFQRHDGIDPDTREWLARNDIQYHGLLYSESKFVDLSVRVEPERVVAVLDDLPEQYDAAAEEFGANVPILRKTCHNIAVERPNTVYTLDEAVFQILVRKRAWEEHHASVG